MRTDFPLKIFCRPDEFVWNSLFHFAQGPGQCQKMYRFLSTSLNPFVSRVGDRSVLAIASDGRVYQTKWRWHIHLGNVTLWAIHMYINQLMCFFIPKLWSVIACVIQHMSDANMTLGVSHIELSLNSDLHKRETLSEESTVNFFQWPSNACGACSG